MKFSLSDLHASSEYAQSHLWTVNFPDLPSLNALNMGGAVGLVFPATDVTEPVFEFKTEEVPIIAGRRLVIPQSVNYYGELSITLRDKSKYEIRQALLDEWVNLTESTPFMFKSIKNIAKKVQIDKYTRTSSGPYKTSVYWVLPPEKSSLVGSSEVGHSPDPLTFSIVGCERKFETIGSP